MPQPAVHATLEEIAAQYRFTPRYLRELIRKHALPVLRSGRLVRFDALALAALEEVLRCPSPSPVADQPARSPSVGMLAERAYSAVLRATIPSSPGRKQPR